MKATNGPFQIVESEDFEGEDSALLYRNYDCKNYERCLGLAAGLDWDDFSCQSCTGEINQSLYWQVRQVQRKDSLVTQICDLPEVSCIDGGDDGAEPGGLRLVHSSKNAVNKS